MSKSHWLLSAGLLALSCPAYAQDVQGKPETDTDRGAAEATQGATAEAAAVDLSAVEQQPVDSADIIITATRRNEALSDVPLAVSAVTAERLEYTGASDIRQLNQVSPSLLVSSTQSESTGGVARIRGIGTVGDNPGLESSVGLFIDGVYRARTGVGLTELGPLERIEVLRGPQGTLFGRNTSAGLISVITAQPSFTPMVAGEASVGNYDMLRLEGSATGPIGGGLAARIDGVFMRRDGFMEDVISGRDVNNRDRWLLRGQALYEPTEDLSVRLIADLSRRDEECCAAAYLPARDVVASGPGEVSYQPSTIAAVERALGAVINDDTYERNAAITPGRDYHNDVKDWGLSGEIVHDFGAAELTSLTAYRVNDLVRGQDADYNNLDILHRESDGGAANRFRTLTQELRLQGEAFGGRLDWLVGGYFANEKLRTRDNLSYGADYARFANCLVAANFASVTTRALLAPTSPTCFNPLVAGAVLPMLPEQQRSVLAAFARLGVFAAPIFNNSGFSNLATAFGRPGLSLENALTQDEWNQASRHWALFTHNIFNVADGLDVTVGARYLRERKTLDATLTDSNPLCAFFAAAVAGLQTLPCVVPSAPGGMFEIEDSRSEGKLSGTAILSYKFSDFLTYASYSRGYKAGGFNLDRSGLRRSNGNGAICISAAQPGCGGFAASGEDLQFEPEINDAIELGAKYNGRGFDVNLALFRQLFRNFQLNTFNGINFIVENINSCEEDLGGADEDNSGATGACPGDTRAGVKSRGVELELFTRPLTDLSWNFGAVYADTRYRDDLVGRDGRPLTTALFQLPGRRVSNSSEWTVTSSLAWTPPVGGSGMRGLFYLDARHMSALNTGSDLDIEKTQDAFTVVNGRIGLHGPGQAWGVELWAQNLLDEDFMQVAFDAPLQGSGTERAVRRGFIPRSTQLYGAFLGEPRTYGLTLRTRWGGRRAMPAYAPAPPPPPLPPIEQVAPPPPPPPPPAPPAGERG